MYKCIMLYLKITLKNEIRQNKYTPYIIPPVHYWLLTCVIYINTFCFFAVNDERAEHTTLEGHIRRRR